MTEPNVLELSIHVAATRETVFAYFTDPKRYIQWMGTAAILEPVRSGAYRVRMRDGVEAAGEFLEIDPPHRLVFSWGWTHHLTVPPGSSRVEVSFEEEGGGTRILLRHHDLPDDEQRVQHGMGWQMYLSRLETRLSGGDPGPDPNA